LAQLSAVTKRDRNTKVKLFVDFAEAVSPFQKILKDTPSPHAVDYLRGLPQDTGCDLGYAADMCLMLTEGLKKAPGHLIKGHPLHWLFSY
jgi:hypothetical protein